MNLEVMATRKFPSTIVFLVALCLAGVPVYSDTNNNCDIGYNVSLSSPETEVCPSKPVTVECNVTKPQDGGQFLLAWECTDPNGDDNERVVLCNSGTIIAEISCVFGKVYDVTGDCICNDTVITSVATFNTTSMCDKLLLCGNGGTEKKQVSVTINGLNPPVMSENYTEVERDIGMYDVTVWWTKGDCAPDNVMYNLTVTDSSRQESVNYSTQQTQYSLLINQSVYYTATVVAQLCNGYLMSNPSNEVVLYIPDTPTTSTPVTTNTPTTSTPVTTNTPTTSTPVTTMTSEPTASSNMTPTQMDGDQNSEGIMVGAIVGTIIGAVAVIVILIVSIVCISAFIRWKLKNKKPPGREEIDLANKYEIEAVTDHPGAALTLPEKETFPKRTQDDTRKRRGVSSVYVDDNFILYSCTKEPEAPHPKEYVLRKCSSDGTFVFAVHGFSPVRGIGRDALGNFYIVDSVNARVLKFDEDLNPIQKTCDKCNTIFNHSFGILVEADRILVCAKRKKQICVLNHNLDLLYNIKLRIHDPIDITKIGENYFVSTKGAILCINFDIEKKSVDVDVYKSFKKGSMNEDFKDDLELRGICAIGKYLYVSEQHKSGRLLCLKFANDELKYVDAIPECAPNAVARHQGKVYFSKGVYAENFSIVEITHEKQKMKETKSFPA